MFEPGDLKKVEAELAAWDRRHGAKRAELEQGRKFVTESGILVQDDVRKMRAAAVNAFLVGEAFMRADDPGAELARLFA